MKPPSKASCRRGNSCRCAPPGRLHDPRGHCLAADWDAQPGTVGALNGMMSFPASLPPFRHRCPGYPPANTASGSTIRAARRPVPSASYQLFRSRRGDGRGARVGGGALTMTNRPALGRAMFWGEGTGGWMGHGIDPCIIPASRSRRAARNGRAHDWRKRRGWRRATSGKRHAGGFSA